jgi:hypothetical protein
MSGIRDASLTLVFEKVISKNDVQITNQMSFLYSYWNKELGETVDDVFPIEVKVNQSSTNAYIALSGAELGDLINVRGEIEVKSIKDEFDNYHNTIEIKAVNACKIDPSSSFENYVCLSGRSGQKRDQPIRQVNIGNGVMHSTKIAVEKMPPRNGWTKNDAGYDNKESAWFEIQARTEDGKGLGNVLEYTRGQPFSVTGKLNVGRSGDKLYISVFAQNIVLQGSKRDDVASTPASSSSSSKSSSKKSSKELESATF